MVAVGPCVLRPGPRQCASRGQRNPSTWQVPGRHNIGRARSIDRSAGGARQAGELRVLRAWKLFLLLPRLVLYAQSANRPAQAIPSAAASRAFPSSSRSGKNCIAASACGPCPTPPGACATPEVLAHRPDEELTLIVKQVAWIGGLFIWRRCRGAQAVAGRCRCARPVHLRRDLRRPR